MELILPNGEIWKPQFKENEVGTKHSYATADMSYDIDSYESASLVLTKNIVVVDIDNGMSQELLEKLMDAHDCRTAYTITENGFHLYYNKYKGQRKTKVEGVCHAGIDIELKFDSTAVNGVCEKYKGVTRQWVGDTIAVFPDCFKILNYGNLRDISMLEEGGRDNALFRYSRALHGTGMQVHEVQRYIIFANTQLLNDPLPDVTKFYDASRQDDNKSSLIDIADVVMRRYDTKVFDKMLMFKDGKRYINDNDKLRSNIALDNYHLTNANIEEVFKQCVHKSNHVEVDHFPVNLKNGSLVNGEFSELQYDGFTPFYMNVNYNHDAPVNETVESMLNHLTDGDEEYRRFIIQMLAYPLVYDFTFKRHNRMIFFIVGSGQNGKGTLLDFVYHLYDGHYNASTNTVDDLLDNARINQSKNKLVNLGDDIEDGTIKEKGMKILKSVSSADLITIRDLYEKSVTTRVAPTLIFTSNHILKSFEKGTSWTSRVKWLPIKSRVTKRDPNFMTKLYTEEAREYMMKLIVEELPNVYNDGMMSCQIVDDFTEEYHKENNNILLWIEELQTMDNIMIPDEDGNDMELNNVKDAILHKKPAEVHGTYSEWCEQEGINPLSQKRLREVIDQELGYEVGSKRVNGVVSKVFKEKKGD